MQRRGELRPDAVGGRKKRLNERLDAARDKPGVLGACLLALIDGDAEDADQVDRQVAAVRMAEWMIRIEMALKKR